MRRATPADVPGIRAVVDAAFSPYVERIGGPPMPMRVDYDDVVREADVRVAESEGEVVGVLVTRLYDDHLLLETVAVAPRLHGTGLGARLLGLAETLAAEAGRSEVRLHTNELMTENLAYYPRRGYVETGRETVGVFHRVLFCKTIPA